jgi:hypothetical protein
MNRCPRCNRTYADNALNFCLEDGTPLVADAAPQFAGRPTLQAPPGVQTWLPMPPAPPRKKSNALWWILGGAAAIAIVGVVVTILIIIANNDSSSQGTTPYANVNNNANVNRANADNTSSPSPSPGLPSSFTDDFSTKKWSTETSDYGALWYANNEYHMRSKENGFLLMCAPNNDYSTENATVRVTVRNVEGISPPTGYGLVVQCAKGSTDKLDSYVFLIYTGDRPQYRVVLRKSGEQTTLVPWTESSAIHSGTDRNRLEVRTTSTSLSFYVNSQYLTGITDSANLRHGLAGFYTSDAHEVAFDDFEITR